VIGASIATLLGALHSSDVEIEAFLWPAVNMKGVNEPVVSTYN
jgi:hypothetical protein